ncbi:DNA-binding transcriptional response regulator, NtrC family, contains REC, AAA-type ATPase, and a Fis-type DNA-binding domains [Treponema bryantii]|uniref:DNA-binding transcriptional response regulator, NtrC family, contains REC, AAA-type ATPase, and a Fis-type DNA-binding domains n=1 Tax=Treponema bryantii TaxID=163 RepID=A0A1I3KBH1_9SPIR|nr:sigma-54 dependent transcriptional regulator [Treponema bryantii]SFI69545.1 DNA-binding transcriptional response regulator, NtrC family, contains REC, AAA-type ATPase, and a Fis-type DNA-binding domains [Treponema bryantii]
MTILTIDDEENIRNGLADNFELEGYDVKQAANGADGLELIAQGGIDLVITDLRMDGISGSEVVKRVTSEHPGIPIIVLTGHGSIDDATAALKAGAFDFLTKPLDLDHLNKIVKNALQGKILAEQNRELKAKLLKSESSDEMIGKSDSLNRVRQMISKAAPAKASVLITGESGVGKELVAKAIHAQSDRADKPFIVVHCAALSETLIESELFGYEKGAFTGAETVHKGRFELADGGTVFLDEIGEVNLATQVKLLRVLQEHKFERVGGEKSIEVDVRVVAATNRNLEDEVKADRFREDLFYRLNVVRIEMPSLRERMDDIPLLMHSFLREFNIENKKNIKGFDKASKSAMIKYSWPGNIRELKNAVESAVVMCTGDEIKMEDLPRALRAQGEEKVITIPIGITMDEAEKIIIQENLAANNGNKSRTADVLGIGRKTLHRKLEELNIE